MIALAIVLLAIAVVLLLVGFVLTNGTLPDAGDYYRARADLHAIRRRLDVADLEHQSQSDQLRLRRELDAELTSVPDTDRSA